MTDEAPLQETWRAFKTLQYQRHNQRRQEHLATLGLELHGRSVLELGAGVGDHTPFFLDRGCRVTSVEPRAELCARYVEALQSAGYLHLSRGPALITAPIEDLDSVLTERFDIVYGYGLLYHLADPATALTLMAKWCQDLLLIETCVSFGDGDELHPVRETASSPTQAFSGVGCRPTRRFVFDRLGKLFEHVYMPTTQPAHEDFPLDWTVSATVGRLDALGFHRVAPPLASPVLVPHIPQCQTRAP
ncbi:MAG: methyltransferase domain-containing protein [Pseudomonadota bacterium]